MREKRVDRYRSERDAQIERDGVILYQTIFEQKKY